MARKKDKYKKNQLIIRQISQKDYRILVYSHRDADKNSKMTLVVVTVERCITVLTYQCKSGF